MRRAAQGRGWEVKEAEKRGAGREVEMGWRRAAQGRSWEVKGAEKRGAGEEAGSGGGGMGWRRGT